MFPKRVQCYILDQVSLLECEVAHRGRGEHELLGMGQTTRAAGSRGMKLRPSVVDLLGGAMALVDDLPMGPTVVAGPELLERSSHPGVRDATGIVEPVVEGLVATQHGAPVH